MGSKQETLQKVKDRDAILQDVMDNISIQSYMCNYNSLNAYAKVAIIQQIAEAYRIERNKQEAPDDKLKELLLFSSKYQIDIQFWPEQTAVFISKDDVDLKDFGGDFDYAINSALEYLNRITSKKATSLTKTSKVMGIKKIARQTNKAKNQFIKWLKENDAEGISEFEGEKSTEWDYYRHVSAFIRNNYYSVYFTVWQGEEKIDYLDDEVSYSNMSTAEFSQLIN